MNQVIKKVDRVKNTQEAARLQNMGVDIIGIELNQNMAYTDDRTISIEAAYSISKVVNKSKLAIEIAPTTSLYDFSKLTKKIRFEFVQFSSNLTPNPNLVKELKKNQINIIKSGIEVSYEDTPTWIIDEDENYENISFFQIGLLGDMQDSWEFFKNQSPQYVDEVQISDIDELANKFPLLVSIDFTTKNVLEVVKRVKNIKGIYLVIAESSDRNDIHFFDYPSVIELLDVLSK